MATLGISTNTRLLGLAIIVQGRLAVYKVQLHKSSWSPSKAHLIVTSLEPCVRRYCIKKVVLSTPLPHHQTAQYRELVSCIEAFFAARNIPVILVPANTIRSRSQGEGRKTKHPFMKALVARYPQLHYYYQKEVRNKNRYYTKLFEAVAAALLP